MLPSIPQFTIFKLLANKGDYKLLTVCQWNDLHILKVSSYSIFKTLSLLVSHEGLLGWQVFCLALWCSFGGMEQLLPELVLGAWLPALESSFPCTWVYMLRPVASDLPRHTSLLWPWAGNLEGVGSFTIRRAVHLSGSAALHLLPETSGVCPSIVSLFPPTSVLLCSKFLRVHLLNWMSYSVLKLCALKIISHSPCPVPVQLSPYIPNPWLFI